MKDVKKSVVVLGALLISLVMSGCSGYQSATQKSNSDISIDRLGAGVLSYSPFPKNFGVAHQAPFFNPVGPISSVFIDGAKQSLDLGFKTFKINLSRGSLIPETNASFYRLPLAEINQIGTLEDAVNSPSIKAVLDLPFDTVFIDADNISLEGRSNNYWNFDSIPMQQADRDAIYRETYDMAVTLLSNYQAQARTFVIQNHEGDSHASLEALPSGAPSDIGLNNFREYWTIRQRAIEDARRDSPSQAKIYHMCEVVQVYHTLTSGQRSLTTEVLPDVACDLVGYSAHDTALQKDGGVMLDQALQLIRSRAQLSPTFGANQVVISEIAVPELLGGAYLDRLDQVARKIVQFIDEGMPWVLYWQMYDNGGGNWMVKEDGSTSLMYSRMVDLFATESRQQRNEYLQEIRSLSMQYFGEISQDDAAVNLQLNVALADGSLAKIDDLFQFIQSTWQKYLQAGPPSYLYVDAEMNYLLNGGSKESLDRLIREEVDKILAANGSTNETGSMEDTGQGQGPVQESIQEPVIDPNEDNNPSNESQNEPQKCVDQMLIAATDSEPLPSGVSQEVKRTYWELLGGIGPFLEGARYITGLRNQGFTLQSLRRDIVNDPAVLNKINQLYQSYLSRNILQSDFENVKNYLNSGGNIRSIELQIVASSECQMR